MKAKKNYWFIALLITFISMLLVGCGQEKEVSSSENEFTNEIATRIVKHKMGETEIPAEPQRILVTLQRIADPMLALGIKPHAITVVGDAGYLGDHLEGIKLIEGFPITPEVVLAEEPDLIVTDPWVDEQRYEQLSKIAPTVVIDGEDWRDYFPNVAKVFDKETEYEQWMKNYENKAADTKQKLSEEIGDQTVMVLRVQESFIGPWSIEGAASKVLYNDLGLKPHENIPNEWGQISLEKLPDYNADHIFLEIRSTTEGSQKYFDDNLKDSSIWNNMKAVKNENIYPIQTDIWIEGDGPIGRNVMMDEILDYLMK